MQRAPATLSGTRSADSATPRLDDRQRQVLDRFVDAWQRCDIDALAALLREDVILSMPPELATITGSAQVTRFFATVPAGGRLDTIRLVRTAANGNQALAAYLPDKSARSTGTGSWSLPSRATASPRSPASPAPTCSTGSACLAYGLTPALGGTDHVLTARHPRTERGRRELGSRRATPSASPRPDSSG